MIKAIIFDLDGTLLDRDRSLTAFIENQYDRYPAFHGVEKNEFVRRFIELDQKGYVWKDRVYQTLVEELQIALNWQDLLTDYVESFQNHCVGFPGLIETLEQLKEKKLKLGIITNGFGRFQMNNIKGLKIEHYFDEILISELEGLRKPDSRLFQRALTRLGVAPEESVFVGDHPINDVEASIAAGMKGIWKEDHHFERPSKVSSVITELSEIKNVLANFEKKKRTIYILSGPAGVGKSTTSQVLVQALERSAYISGDDISHLPVNGRGQPWICEETLKLTWINMASLVKNLIKFDYDVVIDYVAFPRDVDWFRQQLSDYDLTIKYVVFMVDLETLLLRDQLRPKEAQMGKEAPFCLKNLKRL
ncbi:HAD-IA family hydrolase [Cohnella faecalis]|uniref:HAD-IA family hydrolase n=1 Tax=Cohnella faecalis TaxID=2315694 RepID=UPI001F43407B|nr:HAD-IA family hydrolase [Cohnella faecalis]